MFDDIIGKENDIIEVTNESIIEAMRVNIEEKENFINDLIDNITELESYIESIESI